MKLRLGVLITILAMALVGCNSNKEKREKANAFADALNNGGDSTYQLVKTVYDSDYSVYQDLETGEYFAVNIDDFDEDNMKTYVDISDFLVPDNIVRDLTEIVETRWETRYEWDNIYIPGEGNVYAQIPYRVEVDYVYYVGSGFKFNKNEQATKDLATVATLTAEKKSITLALHLESSYGLSSSRAKEVGSLLTHFKSVSERRSITADDYEYMTQELLGTDYKSYLEAKVGKANGESAAFENLVQRAASHNKISAEGMRSILQEF